MGGVLAITLPVFLLIGLGYALGRGGGIDAAAGRALARFVAMVALPALIFRLIAAADPAALGNMRYLAGYAGGTLAVFAAAFLFLRRQRDTAEAAVHAYGTTCSNAGFIGTPVVLQALGPAAAPAIALTMTVENLILLPTLLALSATHADGSSRMMRARTITIGLARSPLILAIFAGLVTMRSGIALPVPLARAIELLAGAASPLALIAIGIGLNGLAVGGLVRPALGVALTKLILHPLAVFAGLHLAGAAAGTMRQAGALLAAVSTATIYAIFAAGRRGGALAAAALLLATLLSFVTLNIALLLIDLQIIT